jgi:hypothetical protein
MGDIDGMWSFRASTPMGEQQGSISGTLSSKGIGTVPLEGSRLP